MRGDFQALILNRGGEEPRMELFARRIRHAFGRSGISNWTIPLTVAENDRVVSSIRKVLPKHPLKIIEYEFD